MKYPILKDLIDQLETIYIHLGIKIKYSPYNPNEEKNPINIDELNEELSIVALMYSDFPGSDKCNEFIWYQKKLHSSLNKN